VFNRPIAAITIWLLSAAPTAQAGSQLFEVSWRVKALGNEITGGTGDSEFYSAVGIPQGVQCNPLQPRCPFESTPTDGFGNFSRRGLGHSSISTPYCRPWAQFGGATARPAKGGTATTGNGRPYPPLYRNPAFFVGPYGAANYTSCSALSTDGAGGPGRVQAGSPLTGVWVAATTGTGRSGFSFAAAPNDRQAGIRGTRIGDRSAFFPYLYSYTYATLRNDTGVFGPGKGPGSFSIPYKVGPTTTVAKVVVKQGAAKFGGTMRMLGQLTSKAGYWLPPEGGRTLSISSPNWRYEAIGAAAYTSDGVVTRGYLATWYSCGGAGYFTCWVHPGYGPVVSLSGSRFPWTTGSVTVTAVGRGPHKTVHYAKGYDNRTPTGGEGTIQLVSPTLTRWFGFVDFETVGVGILRIKFVPEPRAWAMLIAGGSLLGALYRWRR
jgi:hypothetical protein